MIAHALESPRAATKYRDEAIMCYSKTLLLWVWSGYETMRASVCACVIAEIVR